MMTPLWRFCRLSIGMCVLSISFAQEGRASHNCAAHVAHYEKHHRIPAGLLHAISKVESGRRDNTGRVVAWPWTVNAKGKGYYFPSKEAAIAAVRALQFKGIKSIDVGCMQVNLYHHPHAFKTLNDAFDVEKNVAYAASFLTSLKVEHASWSAAVSHYHSANPMYHIPYRKNVLAVWNRDRKTGDVLLAAGSFETHGLSSSRVNRLRRLSTTRKAIHMVNAAHSSTSQGVVRRVTRAASAHIRRVSSR